MLSYYLIEQQKKMSHEDTICSHSFFLLLGGGVGRAFVSTHPLDEAAEPVEGAQ